MNTFDIVDAVVLAKGEDLDSSHVLNQEKYNTLKECCRVIDIVLKDQEAEEVSANIVERNNIEISFKSFNFVFEKGFKDKAYLDMLENTVRMSFSCCGEDILCTTFRFPSVWDIR